MVHQYKSNGYNIVLDVNSGLVHVVDDIAYDVIELFENKSKESIINDLKVKYDEKDITETINEIQELETSGQLFTEDVYQSYIEEVKSRKTVVKALCVHIAHDCNLACKYCFAEEGEYHGKRELMSFEVGKKAFDFLLENSGSRKNLEVDFFGGEPLLNWQVVKDLVAYGRSKESEFGKKFRFTLTTNGVLLDEEIMDFANLEMSNVVLSLDGRREINDYNRPFRNGVGSYDLIVPKYQEFVNKRGDKDYFVRGTFTTRNLDFSKDVIHFADLGFKQMSMEPVVGLDDEAYAIKEENLPKIMEEYDSLSREFITRKKQGNAFNFFHFMIDLEQGPCVAKRLSGCGSGTEYLAVTPNGDLYPCHQFAGTKEYLMGNINEGITRPDIAEEFRACSVYSKDQCNKCFAKFYCSGGCAANSYKFKGNINDTYDIGCKMHQKRVECSIMIKAALADL